jgi:tripartite-type tricarboxylate transporter receptor subunit TctC
MKPAMVGATLFALMSVASAQSNVTKLVVPYPAGGITDQAARIVGERMARELGAPVIIDNRPGGAGRIAIEAVAKAPPDGKTLLFANSSYSILAVIDPKAHFDPLKTLAPVSMSATYSLQIVTSNRVPANTLPEFIAYAKAHPGKLSYGSSGFGSGSNFTGEYLKSLTGTFIVHVPYKSTSAALNDVAGGSLDLAFDASTKPLVDAGRVKLLAVTGSRRDARFPNTPTAQEAGLKGFVQESWIGVLAPASTPSEALLRLNKAAAISVEDAGVRTQLEEIGLRAEGGPISRLATTIRDELTLYRRIATEAKLHFE